MGYRNLFLAFVLLSLSAQFCIAQQPSNVNSLGSTYPYNCELVLQYVDGLIQELEKKPDAVGYIVINRPRKKTKLLNMGGFSYEDIINVYLKSRTWWYSNQNRVKLVRGESEKFKIDFLIAANGSEKPDFTEAKWDFTIPSKPIVFDENYGGQLCAETPFRLNAFAEILRAFPKARGHFVIYAGSLKDFPKEKEGITNDILKIGLPVERFKFFFKRDNLTVYPYAKLWLVPNNRQ